MPGTHPTRPLATPTLEAVGVEGSRFVTRALAAHPAWAAEQRFAPFSGWTRESMQRFLDGLALRDPAQLGTALRELRARVMIRLAVRDLGGIAPLQEVHETMSALAEVSLNAALRHCSAALEALFGVPRTAGERQSLMIVGMGKLGGRELNVSSDIDLVFVYGSDGQTDGARPLDNAEFFRRLGQRVIATIDEPTGDGRVFRVDMRLRPWGDGGPLATSLDALEGYFITHGREWERYAWLKARVVAAAPEAPVSELNTQIRRFVFRRYLDFDAITALRSLHAQIRAEVRRRDLADHVKLGPGGIREIEFIAQAHQLVRGGRDPALQVRPTIAAIEALAGRAIISSETASTLLGAYDFLRRLEHRLQYLDDAQTHSLPESVDDRLIIARGMGFEETGAFDACLAEQREKVERVFAATLGRDPSADPSSEPGPVESGLATLWQGAGEPEEGERLLASLGYAQPAESMRRLQALRRGSRYRTVPAVSQTRMDALAPHLTLACASTTDADTALARMIALIEAVAGRSAYLALLAERPELLVRIASLMAASSWAAGYLTRHPALLDEIILPRDQPAPDMARFVRELQVAIEPHANDTERAMDVMREMHHAEVFRLLTRDLAGDLTLEHLSDHLSALADAVLEATVSACWQRLKGRHRDTPRFAVIAYGKLGGKELGYASDLDLAFLFDDDDPRAIEQYARLAQRVVSWLSSRTAAGILFETDLRLRPNGDAGLLVTSIEAFREYQRNAAWAWEHQALTRARFCAGDPALGRAFEAARLDVLSRRRDTDTLAREVRAMRSRIDATHPNTSGLFDLKYGRGGMIDIEFVVQTLVLAHAFEHPSLRANAGNIALLHEAARLGLITPRLATDAANAYRAMRRMQHALRLNEVAEARLAFETVAHEAEAARALWQAVLGER
jgi:glutamate-ammonia-ligase adenylyltransferase